MKYITSIGQKTGMSKTLNQLHTNAMLTARVDAYQNLNSGSRLMNGRNSSEDFVGSVGTPASSTESSENAGSNLGWRKARKRLRR